MTDAPMAASAPGPVVARVAAGADPLRFARFAYPPNALGYCGGDDAVGLLQHLAAGVVDPDLVRLCRAFEGAYPYLERIAAAASIAEPLDGRVVEAYWVGGDLLAQVAPRDFHDDLDRRFRDRTARAEWPWLAGKPAAGGLPHHSFHVLEVFPRVGLLRGGAADIVPTMEQCLVRPARVTGVDDAQLAVMVRPLELHAGRLRLGAARPGSCRRRVRGLTVLPDVAVGDTVAIHWGWACDRLDDQRRIALERALARSLALANATI
ncbi:MAG: DUF6390 family protein [Candidatus Limnocylindrales bacterium]